MESTDNIYMDYIHHSMLGKSEESDWTELNKNHTEASILSLTQSPIPPPTHFPNVIFTHNNITEYGESFFKIDGTFLGLFLGLPNGIAAMTGFISGSATLKTNCCVSSVRGIIILATTDFSLPNLWLTLQNQPPFDQDVADRIMLATPNIMKGVTTLTTTGFAIGSLFYNREDQINAYQHISTLIWIIVTAPAIFYAVENCINRANNIQHAPIEQPVVELPLNNFI